MKKVFLAVLVVSVAGMFSGCATWSGIKHDSKSAWNSTKKAVNNATSD